MHAPDVVLFLGTFLSLTLITVFALGSVIGSAGLVKEALLAVRSGHPGLARLAGVVTICLALAAAGYGVAEMASHFLQVPMEATAAVTRDGAVVNPEPQAAARYSALATSEPPRDQVVSPRECALDMGITQACTFN